MTLQEQIDNDIRDAMRARAADRLGLLRMLKSAIKYAAIEGAGLDAGLSDDAVIQVIRKEIKKRQDSIESFNKGGRPELAEREAAEIEILNSYLPQPLSPEAISEIVRTAIAEAGATTRQQMGAVMKIASVQCAGRVDGKSLSAEVQRQLV
ncbi:MAG: GatB/YqeY domain-containing protein [Chthoniobacterales bacterium]